MQKFTFAVLAAGAVVAGLTLATDGCYNPNIPDGKLSCALNGGQACPSGFVCRVSDSKCVKNGELTGGTGGAVIGTGGAPGTGGVVGTGGTPGTGGAAAECVMPVPKCTPMMGSGDACDPVCQSGCNCQRCNLSTDTLRCEPLAGPLASLKGPYEKCAQATQTTPDNCQPTTVCLPEPQTVCDSHCYSYCRTDNDCTLGAHCTVELTVGDQTGSSVTTLSQKVCDNPPENCNPFFGLATCANALTRPPTAFGCYIMSLDNPNEAVCDCAGVKNEGDACDAERACKAGLVCVRDGSAGSGSADAAHCHRVCPMLNKMLAQQICNMKECRVYGTSTKFGYCLN